MPFARRDDMTNAANMQVLGPGGNPTTSQNVDDGLTSLSWLQNLNMCMTRLGAPTPPTPPASPNGTVASSHHHSSAQPLFGQYRPLLHNQHLAGTGQHGVTPSPSRNASAQNASHQSRHSQPTLHANGSNAHPRQRENTGGGGGRSKKASQQQHQPEHDPIDYKTNGSVKPPFSYATLICMAMKANKNKMTLNSIYKWIRENFLYYQNADPSWQVSATRFFVFALKV